MHPIKQASWLCGCSNFYFISVIYGEMTFLRRWKVSFLLFKWKPSGKSAAGSEWVVAPVNIIWKSNVSPCKVSYNVSAMTPLLSAPCIGTFLESFSVMVTLEVNTCLDVWSTFIMSLEYYTFVRRYKYYAKMKSGFQFTKLQHQLALTWSQIFRWNLFFYTKN